MRILHRHKADDPPGPAPESPPDPPLPPAAGIAVLLSPGLAELAPGLAQVLGSAFAVQTEHVGPSRVLVTGPVGPAGVAFLRVSYPGTGLIVVDRRWSRRRPAEAVGILDAGADDYLCSPSLAELASHVDTVARRYPDRVTRPGGSPSPASAA